MRRLAASTFVLGFAAVSMLATAGGAQAESERKFVTIGTGGPTGVYFVVGNAICRMVHKEAAEGRSEGRRHGLRCAAPSSGGSTYNIAQVTEGEFDFGVAQSDWQYHSVNESNPDKVTPNPDLRAVFSVHPEPYQVIAAKGSGIESFADLKGKRFNIGNEGSGQRGTTEVLMEAYGWTVDDFALATEFTSTEQAGKLCDGQIDAFGYTVGVPNAGVAQAIDGCDAYIVNLDSEIEQELVEANPYYAFATIPEGTYTTTDEDVTTFGVMATVITDASVDADAVYEVTRAVMANIEDFRALHPAFANLDPQKMITDGLSAPLHEGAARYYKEQGWID